MQITADSLFFAPSDLITYMESAFASHMERWRLADENIKALMDPEDPMLVTLRRKGYAHKSACLEPLKAEGKTSLKSEMRPWTQYYLRHAPQCRTARRSSHRPISSEIALMACPCEPILTFSHQTDMTVFVI